MDNITDIFDNRAVFMNIGTVHYVNMLYTVISYISVIQFNVQISLADLLMKQISTNINKWAEYDTNKFPLTLHLKQILLDDLDSLNITLINMHNDFKTVQTLSFKNSRKKRALCTICGKISKFIYGTTTEDDLRVLDAKITKINAS